MSMEHSGDNDGLRRLTARELSVLDLLSSGLSNEGIAQALSVSGKTVEGALRSVFLKLGLGFDAPSENRRVKAALIYLGVTRTVAERGSRLSRDLRDLMATAPFESIASTLEQRSYETGKQSWVLRATAAWYAVILEDFDRAGRLARRARDVAADSELGRSITNGLLATIDAFQGLAPIDHTALDGVAHSMTLPDSSDELAHLCANLEVPNWFTFADRFAEADALVTRFVDHDCLDTLEQLALLCCQVEVDLRVGRWDQAESSLVAVVELSRLSGIATGYADALAARLYALRGDEVTSRAHLARSRAAGADRGDGSTIWRADAAECCLLLGAGQHHAAATLAGSLVEARAGAGLRLPSVRWWDLDTVEALVRSGEIDRARALVTELAGDVAATGSVSGEALLCVARAVIAQATGAGTGVDDLERAVSIFRSLGTPFELARASLLLADASRDSSPTVAFDAVHVALTVFDALGAEVWSAVTRQRLDLPNSG